MNRLCTLPSKLVIAYLMVLVITETKRKQEKVCAVL